jgi:hypothetical protein
MPLRTIHNTFTRGELDKTLLARVDLAFFTQGARKLRNMIGLWTGAARIAAGTISADMLVDRNNGNAPITNPELINGIDFQYSFEDDLVYFLIFRPDTINTVAIDIYLDRVLVATVAATMYTQAQIKDLHFAVGQDRVLILHGDVATRQLVRGANSASWTLSTFTPSIYPVFDYTVIGGTQYRVAGFTFTPGATTGSTTLTASSAIFTANHVGGLYVGGGGIARITAVGSTTSATITVLNDFTSTAAIPGTLSSLNEIMWTAGGGVPAGEFRGFPRRGAFFLNRLILGNTPTIPNVVALSTAGVYDNFDDSEADDLAGFSATFNGKGLQSIQSIVTNDSILFLTTNKVFAQNPLIDTPLTVSSFFFAPQNQDPASDIDAVTIDNQALHVSGNYTQVMQVVYETAEGKYKAIPASLLSSDLITSINTNASWEPPNIDARLYLASQDDGTLLFYNTLFDQQVQAWSLRNTRGFFRRVIGSGTQANVVVEREINLGTSFSNNIDYAYLTNTQMTAFNDVTADFADAGTNTQLFENQYDYIVLGNIVPFTALSFTLATLANVSLAPTFEYLDGNGNWNVFTPTDNTNGFTASGTITWDFTDVGNWMPGVVNSLEETFYWIRIRRTTATVVILPIESVMTINTGTRLYLEQLSFDYYTDATTITSSNANGGIAGLSSLAGMQVYARANGATYGPFFVEADGSTNIGKEFAVVEIGMQYKPLLIPMPMYTPTQEGDNTYIEKYVEDLYIDYVDSLYLQAGIGAQSTDVPIIPLGAYTLGTPVQPVTDVYLIHPRGDWEPRQEIRVTQSLPGPMTIIGVGYTVELT